MFILSISQSKPSYCHIMTWSISTKSVCYYFISFNMWSKAFLSVTWYFVNFTNTKILPKVIIIWFGFTFFNKFTHSITKWNEMDIYMYESIIISFLLIFLCIIFTHGSTTLLLKQRNIKNSVTWGAELCLHRKYLVNYVFVHIMQCCLICTNCVLILYQKCFRAT